VAFAPDPASTVTAARVLPAFEEAAAVAFEVVFADPPA
jgi:hypothetical protein